VVVAAGQVTEMTLELAVVAVLVGLEVLQLVNYLEETAQQRQF
jgi:hypothetical protein